MTVELLDSPPAFSPRGAEAAADDIARPGVLARVVTVLVVVGPLVGLVVAVARFWERGIGLRDLLLAASLYVLTGCGITIGFHRLLTHRAFAARRPLKIALVALGSMAYEGGPIEWVANHRRHHAFADREGDPHSPGWDDGSLRGQLKGFWHAHVGWLFTASPTSSRRYARDLRNDRDLVVLNKLFPLFCVVSFAVPFALGWVLGGDLGAAFSAFLWAGLVRVWLLHHATWSINSLCHMFGRRPFSSPDRSGNVRVLAVISLGESWHNGHHAFPRSARHGLLKGQWDVAARFIRIFERLGWASDVQWPTPEMLRGRRQPG